MYFVDVQGTLIDDEAQRPIPGAIDFIDRLNRQGIPYLVVTNNTKRPSGEFLQYLCEAGFDLTATHYLDALMMLEAILPEGGVAAYGSDAFVAQVEAMGYALEYDHPGSVLVSVRDDYDAETFARMIECIMHGAELIGMHDTTLYVKHAKRYPGAGAVIRMLSYAASVPFQIVGKPSEAFYTEALQRLRQQNADASFERVTMISDDYAGDLAGAAGLGMKTALVLSGKVRPEDALARRLRREESGVMVYNDVTEIMKSTE